MKTIKTFVLTAISLASFSGLALAEAELDGYCPVCYVAAGKAVEGVEEFKSDYKGKSYLFVKQGAKDAFDADPEKFLPAYDGLCAYGMSKGKKFESDPTLFSVIDGVIYLNFNEKVKAEFDKDPKSFIAKADANWAEMSAKADKK